MRIRNLMLAALLIGCASSSPSPELVSARAAFYRMQSGPAGEVVPAEVHAAKVALDRAEKTGDGTDAYVAERKSQLADTVAQMVLAQHDRERAEKEVQAARLAQGEQAKSRLKLAEQRLSDAEQRHQMTERQLAEERAAREDAESRAKEALEKLALTAIVKTETRGIVITLSGQVLFVTNQAVLLPAATAALDNVALALQTEPYRNIIIEGHTDSTGTHAYNMDLSQRRAESVRTYLIARGIAAEVMLAHGIGPDRPVADNRSPEGRANNRRVEIILSPPEFK